MPSAITNLDFYKSTHRLQYPSNTTKVYSNFTPRSARLFKGSTDYDNKVVVFGLQMFIKDFLIKEFNDSFFNRPLGKTLRKYKRRMQAALGGDFDVSHIEALHNLGYLPLEIKALEEGTRSPIKTPVLTITNTLPEFFWLVNYIETVMSTELWKPITVATTAYEYKRTALKYAKLTGVDKAFVDFQCHDFSARGLANREEGYKASVGFLTSFVGTDTVRAIDGAEDFYNVDVDTELVGASVAASEHATVTFGINDYITLNNLPDTDESRRIGEEAFIKRMLTEVYPTGIYSHVSDSYDFWNTLTTTLPNLKETILSRDGKLVIRPDSGNPVDIICGTINGCRPVTDGGEYYKLINPEDYTKTKTVPITENEYKGAVEILWDIFGGTINDKGFKVLDEHIGLIYGDSITLERQEEILKRLMDKGFASSNIIFGVGSYSLSMHSRDTLGFAMKATYGETTEGSREIFKDPKTDSGTKKSAKGLLRVNDDLTLTDRCTLEEEQSGMLKTVFLDGKLLNETTLKQIRANLAQ